MEQVMKEEWRDIKNYEGLYQVSNLGNVRRLRFINNHVNKNKVYPIALTDGFGGYKKAVLYKGGKYENRYVHRLVAEAFLANPEEKPQVNHKDGNKNNNASTNLEWCTRSENMLHAYRTGLTHAAAAGKYGSDSKKARPVAMIDKETGKTLCVFGSLIDAAHHVGAKKSCHIVSCCKGRLKWAYGYMWRYA